MVNSQAAPETHQNNFDMLRFIAAFLVIFSHSYALSGHENEPLLVVSGYWASGALGVFIFFIISGYLITKSWVTKPVPIRFFWNRVLRIVPGIMVVVLFTILVIGPLNTNLSLVDYFSSQMTWAYLLIMAIFPLFQQVPTFQQDFFRLPGVFTTNPFPYVVNGSLWTIPFEFTAYVGLFLTGLYGLLKNRKSMIVLSMSLFGLYVASRYLLSGITGYEIINQLFLFGFYFSIGVLYYLYKDRVKLDPKIAVLLAIVWALSFGTNIYVFLIATFACVPYVVFTFAQLPVRRFNNFGKYGDFSYGMYIYAYPIQQTMAHYLSPTTPVYLFFGSMPVIMVLSFLSWHLIESRALQLKKYTPIAFIDRWLNNKKIRDPDTSAR